MDDPILHSGGCEDFGLADRCNRESHGPGLQLERGDLGDLVRLGVRAKGKAFCPDGFRHSGDVPLEDVEVDQDVRRVNRGGDARRSGHSRAR